MYYDAVVLACLGVFELSLFVDKVGVYLYFCTLAGDAFTLESDQRLLKD